jgi:hypothetical protein
MPRRVYGLVAAIHQSEGKRFFFEKKNQKTFTNFG